jgi:hypothetical protein
MIKTKERTFYARDKNRLDCVLLVMKNFDKSQNIPCSPVVHALLIIYFLFSQSSVHCK